MVETEPVETCFLKYAFPCTFILKMRGQVNENTFQFLERSALDGKKVDRQLLESTYKKAFARMKKVARELGKPSVWEAGVVREYFVNRHNEEIAQDEEYRNSPPAIQELCKTMKAKVADQREGVLVVRYGETTRTVSNVFVPQVKIGDEVIIHYGFAVEVV